MPQDIQIAVDVQFTATLFIDRSRFPETLSIIEVREVAEHRAADAIRVVFDRMDDASAGGLCRGSLRDVCAVSVRLEWAK